MQRRLGRGIAAACLVIGVGVPRVAAQTSPFVPETVYRALVNELSGDRAFEHDRQLTRFHRTGGSRDFFAAAEYIRAAAAAAGLEDVRLVRQKWSGQDWSCRSGEAWLLDPEETKLAFKDGMFRTGDVGCRDADGYFYILDRVKDMIVTGGENV